MVEQVYRKTHTLKGAARAVNQKEIETVCQSLETVFSAIKKSEFVPGPEAYDLFHEAVKIIRSLLAGEEGRGPPLRDRARTPLIVGIQPDSH